MSIATPQELVSHAVGAEMLDKTKIKTRKEMLFRETKKKTEKAHFQESLTTLQGESELSVDKLNQILNNVGTKIDEDSGKISADTITDATGRSEQSIVNDMRDKIRIVTEIADKGFDALKEEDKKIIREAVEKRILSNSAISKDYSLRNDKQNYLEDLIKSPAFLPRLKEIVNEYAREGDLDSSFINFYEEWKEAEADVKAEETKENHASDKLKRIKIDLRAYEKDENGVEGPLYGKMTSLQEQGSAPQEEITQLEQGIGELRDEIRRLDQQVSMGMTTLGKAPFAIEEAKQNISDIRASITRQEGTLRDEQAKQTPNTSVVDRIEGQLELKRASLQKATSQLQTLEQTQAPMDINSIYGRIDQLRKDMRDRETELAKKKAAVNDFSTFHNQYELLKQQEDQAVRELAEATADKAKAEAKMQKARQEYDKAVNLRKGQQEAFLERLTSSYGEAGHRVIVQEMITANSQAQILHDQFEQESFKDAEQALNNYLSGERWHLPPRSELRGIPGFRRRITYRPINRSIISADWQTLSKFGEEALVKNMLLGATNPDTGKHYEPPEIDDALDDEETMRNMKEIAVKSLILKRIQNGGMTPEDLDVAVQRKMGMNIEAAINQRGELRQQVIDMLGVDGLERHDFKSRLAQVIRKHPWLLLSLLGFPAAVIAAFRMNREDEQLHSQR